MSHKRRRPTDVGAAATTTVAAATSPSLSSTVRLADPAPLRAQFRRGLPFPHVLVSDVFPDAALSRVRNELLRATYKQKRNDLYHFEQTDELRDCAPGTATAELRDFLYSERFRSWATALTGIPTNDTVDISAASYTDGSYLLCHDDDLAERRIAFILYLVPEGWDAERDGGGLDLFSVDPGANGTVPDRVVASLSPSWNSMAFFEVSHVSHHQVGGTYGGVACYVVFVYAVGMGKEGMHNFATPPILLNEHHCSDLGCIVF